MGSLTDAKVEMLTGADLMNTGMIDTTVSGSAKPARKPIGRDGKAQVPPIEVSTGVTEHEL